MDKQNRLTRFDEWEVGAIYHWDYGVQFGVDRRYKCIKLDTSHHRNRVELERTKEPEKVGIWKLERSSWKGQFKKSNMAAESK